MVRSKRCRIMDSTSCASWRAKPRPMQERMPLPKGFQAFGGSVCAVSGAKRSGRNASGSSQTAGSRCSIGVRTNSVSSGVTG